jgi:hypothetical protein
MQIRPVRAELLYADGRTDMEELIFALRSFANEPKNKQITYSENWIKSTDFTFWLQ